MMRPEQRGDTIIEVLFAISVFSLVAIGAMTIMNRGMITAQRSLETTLVRQQIDGQAELLRFLHTRATGDTPQAAEAALWQQLPKGRAAPREGFGLDRCPQQFEAQEFTLYTAQDQIRRSTTYHEPVTYARQEGDAAYGLRIQLVRAEGGNAYDAYIQACWYSPGLARPMTIGTIVRLYDPRA